MANRLRNLIAGLIIGAGAYGCTTMPPPKLADYYNPQSQYCDNPFTQEEDQIPIKDLDKIIYDSV